MAHATILKCFIARIPFLTPYNQGCIWPSSCPDASSRSSAPARCVYILFMFRPMFRWTNAVVVLHVHTSYFPAIFSCSMLQTLPRYVPSRRSRVGCHPYLLNYRTPRRRWCSVRMGVLVSDMTSQVCVCVCVSMMISSLSSRLHPFIHLESTK